MLRDFDGVEDAFSLQLQLAVAEPFLVILLRQLWNLGLLVVSVVAAHLFGCAFDCL